MPLLFMIIAFVKPSKCKLDFTPGNHTFHYILCVLFFLLYVVEVASVARILL
jgi:hypothetical protein